MGDERLTMQRSEGASRRGTKTGCEACGSRAWRSSGIFWFSIYLLLLLLFDEFRLLQKEACYLAGMELNVLRCFVLYEYFDPLCLASPCLAKWEKKRLKSREVVLMFGRIVPPNLTLHLLKPLLKGVPEPPSLD